jgi:hypothetical protein
MEQYSDGIYIIVVRCMCKHVMRGEISGGQVGRGTTLDGGRVLGTGTRESV